MWPTKRNRINELQHLAAQIEVATEIGERLVQEVLAHACPRLAILPGPSPEVARLAEAEAWVELGFWLIGWELPDWVIHRLSCDDQRWNCSICVRGLAINWVEDVAEFQHAEPALAIMGALVQAQLQKSLGRAPSNVTPFRRTERAEPESRPSGTERP